MVAGVRKKIEKYPHGEEKVDIKTEEHKR